MGLHHCCRTQRIQDDCLVAASVVTMKTVQQRHVQRRPTNLVIRLDSGHDRDADLSVTDEATVESKMTGKLLKT